MWNVLCEQLKQLKVTEHSFELIKSVIVSIYFYQIAVLISIKHQNFQVEVFEKLHAELMLLMIKYLSFLMKKGFRKKGPSHLMIMYFD